MKVKLDLAAAKKNVLWWRDVHISLPPLIRTVSQGMPEISSLFRESL